MKSENDLTITGTVTSDVQPAPSQSSIRFRIVHNFGGGRNPLYLDCVLIFREGSSLSVPRKGNQVKIRAYLRMRSATIEAVIKTILIE